jgi:hypothetical protein
MNEVGVRTSVIQPIYKGEIYSHQLLDKKIIYKEL